MVITQFDMVRIFTTEIMRVANFERAGSIFSERSRPRSARCLQVPGASDRLEIGAEILLEHQCLGKCPVSRRHDLHLNAQHSFQLFWVYSIVRGGEIANLSVEGLPLLAAAIGKYRGIFRK